MNYKNLVKTSDAYSQGSIVTIGPILEGYKAEEMGNGDGNEGAVECARGIDFSEFEPETQTIAYRRYVDTVGDIDIFYDYGADYYFFSPNDMGAGDYVNDSHKVKDSDARDSRFEGLVDTIDYYDGLFDARHRLSEGQQKDLAETRNSIVVFGQRGLKWAMLANDILHECGYVDTDKFKTMYKDEYVVDSLDSFNDAASFSDILEENGYGYSDFMDVRSKDGRTGTRYRLEADRGANPSGLEEALKAAYGEDKVIFSTGVNRYAPEQKIKSVIILDSRHKVKDSFSDIDFFITEDNVYDLIHEGTTSVAIPSGVDTKAFVAAVEDVIKDVAKDCGYKGLKLSTEIVGNMLNIFNNK